MGAPSKFTPALGEAICEQIASGKSVEKACEFVGVEGRTFYRWLAAKDPVGAEERPFEALSQQYLHARAVRADARFERIDQVLVDMRSKKIDHNQARVEIDAIKWQTGKENAKRYGEAMTLRGDADNPLPAPQFIIAPIAPAPSKEE